MWRLLRFFFVCLGLSVLSLAVQSLFSFSFAQQTLGFGQPRYTSQLFCPGTYVPVAFAATADDFSSLQIDLPHRSDMDYGPGTPWSPVGLNVALRNPSQRVLWQDYFRVIANANNPWSTSGSRLLGTFVPQPLVFMRTATLQIASAPQSRIMDTSNNNVLSNAWSTILDYTLWPCHPDIVRPVITFNSARHTDGYTSAQYNTIDYDIDLTDLGWGFDWWFTSDPGPDPLAGWWQSGVGYADTVERWSWISSGTWAFTVEIEDETLVTTMTNTNNNSFTPFEKTRDWKDKNYHTDFGYALVRPTDFPIEKQVTIQATVNDRAWNTSAPYRVDFNHGADPWIGFGPGQGPTLSCGDLSDAVWQWAYIIRNVDGYTVPSFDLFVHDDRAGVDTGSVNVTFSGMLPDGTLYLETFSYGDSELSFDPFVWINSVAIDTYASPGTQTQSIVSSSDDRNYRLTINNPTVFGAETPLEIWIDYADLRSPSRSGKRVSCDFDGIQEAPQNDPREMVIERTSFAQGWQIRPVTITLTDNRAWVSMTGSQLTIDGYTLNATDDALVPVSLVYDQTTTPRLSDLITRQFTTFPAGVVWWQPYNYDITFAQTWSLSTFTDYFAPEQPITLRIDYVDRSPFRFANDDDKTRDLPAPPYPMEYDGVTAFDRYSVFPLDVYLTTPLGQYPYQRSLRDDWASMLPDYNLVRFSWRRRWQDVVYEYRSPTSLLNYTPTSPAYQGWLIETTTTRPVTTNQTLFPSMDEPLALRQMIQTWPYMYFDYNATLQIELAGADKRVPPFVENFTHTRPTSDIVCAYDCSFDRLFFVRGDFPDDHPLTDTFGRYAPYTGQHVSVLWSGVIIDPDGGPDEWWLIICNGSWWLAQTNQLTFAPGTFRDATTSSRVSTPVTVDYTGTVLYIADGEYDYGSGIVQTY